MLKFKIFLMNDPVCNRRNQTYHAKQKDRKPDEKLKTELMKQIRQDPESGTDIHFVYHT